MGIDANDMMICGGGAKSPLWRQMLADIYGVDVVVPASSEGAALGVAILAMVGIGQYKTVQQACSAIIKKDKVTNANKQSHDQYEPFYRLYRSLYPSLKQSYQQLNNI